MPTQEGRLPQEAEPPHRRAERPRIAPHGHDWYGNSTHQHNLCEGSLNTAPSGHGRTEASGGTDPRPGRTCGLRPVRAALHLFPARLPNPGSNSIGETGYPQDCGPSHGPVRRTPGQFWNREGRPVKGVA